MRYLFAILLFICCGCQSPATIYTNGLILWCSTTAIGIGWGEYAEVPSGGKLVRVTTNSCARIIGSGDSATISRLIIDNSLIPTDQPKQVDGADIIP